MLYNMSVRRYNAEDMREISSAIVVGEAINISKYVIDENFRIVLNLIY